MSTTVRRVIATFFMSLDGVVEAPERWHFPYRNQEMDDAIAAGMSRTDTYLHGRKTYEIMAAAWPEREAIGDDDDGMASFAKTLGDARKIVVSNQRVDLTWRNSAQLEGELIEGVTALKNRPGGDIALTGSISITRQLLAAGLLDELRFFLDPIALGRGERLFKDTPTHPLKLVSHKTFTTGVLDLVYTPDNPAVS